MKETPRIIWTNDAASAESVLDRVERPSSSFSMGDERVGCVVALTESERLWLVDILKVAIS